MAKEELQEGRGAGRGWSGWWQGRHCIRFGGPATGAAIQMTLTRFLRFRSLLIVKTISYLLMKENKLISSNYIYLFKN